MTGTPIQNDLSEYFALLNFANPDYLGSKMDFKKNFESKILRGRDADATDKDKLESDAKLKELGGLVSKFIIRRTNDLLSKYRKFASSCHKVTADVQSRSNTNMWSSVGRASFKRISTTPLSRLKMCRGCFEAKIRNHSKPSVFFANWSITQICFSFQKICLEAKTSCLRTIRAKGGTER